MAQFFSGGGDDGFTGMLGSDRLPKHHPRMEAVGAVDEASSALGMARAFARADGVNPLILQVQRDLYGLMAEVAAAPQHAARFRSIDGAKVAWLEEQTTQLGGQILMPDEFIVPGDTPGGAALDLARSVVRRAERRVSDLLSLGELENRELLRYLNRLSSFCFVLELYENQQAGQANPTLAKT